MDIHTFDMLEIGDEVVLNDTGEILVVVERSPFYVALDYPPHDPLIIPHDDCKCISLHVANAIAAVG